jgi:hypothetical protein
LCKWRCGSLPQCQTDGLSSFSTSAKQTVLLHINQQKILTSDEIANSTYIYTLSRPEYKYAPASKDQTQSHLHSQQVNAKFASSSARGLPASHSATYEHWAGSPRNECFSLPHRLYRKPGPKTPAKKTYNHPACPPLNGCFKPTSPVVSQTGAQSFHKEDLQASNMSPTQQACFTTTSAVCCKRPFTWPTAASMCPCNDSREQWC